MVTWPPAGTVMTVFDIGWWKGLIPPLQITSLEVTSWIGYKQHCELLVGDSNLLEGAYTIVIRDPNSINVTLVYAINVELLGVMVSNPGATGAVQ